MKNDPAFTYEETVQVKEQEYILYIYVHGFLCLDNDLVSS